MEPAPVPLKTDACASPESLRIATCLVSDWPCTVEQRVFINVLTDFERVIHHHIQHDDFRAALEVLKKQVIYIYILLVFRRSWPSLHAVFHLILKCPWNNEK